jgi:hypothetical protein
MWTESTLWKCLRNGISFQVKIESQLGLEKYSKVGIPIKNFVIGRSLTAMA